MYKICNSKCVTRFSLIQIYNSAKIKTIELIPCIVGSDSAHRSSNAYCDIIIKKYTRSYEGNSNLFDLPALKKEKKKPNKKTHTIESKWKEATNPRD